MAVEVASNYNSRRLPSKQKTYSKSGGQGGAGGRLAREESFGRPSASQLSRTYRHPSSLRRNGNLPKELGHEESVKSIDNRRIDSNKVQSARTGLLPISSRVSSPKIRVVKNREPPTPAPQRERTLGELNRMDSFGVKITTSISSKPSSPKQEKALVTTSNTIAAKVGLETSLNSKGKKIMISANDEVLDVSASLNQNDTSGHQTEDDGKSKLKRPSMLAPKKKKSILIAQPPPLPIPEAGAEDQTQSRRRRRISTNILSSIRIVTESNGADEFDNLGTSKPYTIDEEDFGRPSSKLHGRPTSASKTKDISISKSQTDRESSQAKYVSSGTSTIANSRMRPMKGEFIPPPLGTYMGDVFHTQIMGPNFPLPDKAVILFGPYKETLDTVINELNIVHAYDTLDNYYVPSIKLTKVVAKAIRKEHKETSKQPFPKTPNNAPKESILLPFQRPKTSTMLS